MKLRTLIFTENDCYKAGRKIKPTGIMVHSTGANNPRLKRYVGPDDGLLGENVNGNHWNKPGISKCVHAFIGKLEDGTIATYQVLPWDHRAWHCGTGSKGTGNSTHISFEICEDGLTDPTYFGKVYQEAVDLCVYLCRLYGLTEKNIIDHSEGRALGLASNHGDVKHWFPKHGKSMDTLRAAVKAQLSGTQTVKEPEIVGDLYRVQVGAFSKKTNATRKLEAVKAAGFDDAIVASVDGNLWRVQVGAYAEKSNAVKMQTKLAEAGFTGFVTRLSGKTETATTTEPAAPKKSVEEIAREVIRGKWGNGAERRARLTAAGYNYEEVQADVSRLMK